MSRHRLSGNLGYELNRQAAAREADPEPCLDEQPCRCSQDELAQWLRLLAKDRNPATVTPNDLMRRPHHLTWNGACGALEDLERRGDLERVPGPSLAWRPTPPPAKPGKGYALPLTPKEHAALLRLLDAAVTDDPANLKGWRGFKDGKVEIPLLRSLRAKLKRPA